MNMRDEIAQHLADWLVSNKPPHDGADAIIAALNTDALVRAALERSEQAARGFYRERPGLGEKRAPDRSDMGRGVQRGKEQAADAIRALADDEESITAIKKNAGWV